MAESSRKRQSIPISKKVEIIKYMEANPSKKQTEVAETFGMNTKTLNNIVKAKTKIMEGAGKRSDGRKRFRNNNFEDVDAALILWFKQHYGRPQIRIDGDILLRKAAYFASEFDYATPPSASWINRWKKRWGIGKIMKSGEAGGVDLDVVEAWRTGELQRILQEYAPSNIYNCDETGLFWQMLPEKSLGFIGEKQSGRKQPKTRMTLLVGSNMDGSDMMPLLAIGKSAKPRAFKGVKKLPVRYLSNRKAWMRSDIFEAEMHKFDRRMKNEGRKVCMIVDNCSAHPHMELENTELVFLPPNTTSHTQPMDSGIIKNLKFFYRRILADKRLQAAEANTDFNWDILDCLMAVKDSWKQVKRETIVNCWRKAGFEVQTPTVQPEDGEVAGDRDDPMVSVQDEHVPGREQEEVQIFRNIWERLADVLRVDLPDLNDYLDVDEDDVETVAELTDQEIVMEVKDMNEQDGEEEPEATGAEVTEITTLQAQQAIDCLKRYIVKSDIPDNVNEEFMAAVSKVDKHLIMTKIQKSTQKKITDFFK